MSAVLEKKSGPAAAVDSADLRQRFAAARSSGLRAKDAAEQLGLSEGAAIAAHTSGDGALQSTPLQKSWVEILQALEPCGPVMALTRNHSAVH